MAATPSDIAKYTSDGVIITSSNSSILTNHAEAEDLGEDVIDMFFDAATDAASVLASMFTILSQINGAHEAVVVEESLGIGSTIAITPTTPCFRAIDDERAIDTVLRTRAYAYEAGSDEFSIEIIA